MGTVAAQDLPRDHALVDLVGAIVDARGAFVLVGACESAARIAIDDVGWQPASVAPVSEMEPIALIAAQIVEESIKPDVEVSKLSSLAQCDPAFAAKLLTCVNSAAFGLSRRVTDVRQAVSLIGIRSLRNLGLSLALSDMVPAADGVVLLANCIRRAAAARGRSAARWPGRRGPPPARPPR